MGLSAVVFGVLWRDGGCVDSGGGGGGAAAGVSGGAAERGTDHAAESAAADCDAGLALAVPRHRGGDHEGRGELLGISRGVSAAGAGLSRRRRAGAVFDSAGGDCRVLGAAASLGHRAHAVRDRLQSGRRALRGNSGAAAGGAAVLSCRAWCRAWPPSFMWRTWDRRSRTPVRGTNWRRSRRWCWAARQCLRRTRHGMGHGARAVRDFGVAERTAPGGAALGDDGRPDGRGAGVDDRSGASAGARAEQ